MPNDTRPWPAPPHPVRHVADAVREANTVADWTRVRELYRQVVAMLPEPPPDDLAGALAEALTALVPAYAGRIGLLEPHTYAVFAAAEGFELLDDTLFRHLYDDKRFTRAGERHPPPLQTVVETCRRLRDADRLGTLLRGKGSSAILCGSVDYGAFYNVRAASDLDLVVVIDETATLPTLADGLALLPGVVDADVARFAGRAAIFAGRYDDGNTSFSHKVTVHSDSTYLISVHVLTRPLLRYVLAGSATRLAPDEAGTVRTILDYRETTTGRLDVHRTFAGRRHTRDATLTPAQGGTLRTTSAYVIDETGAYGLGFVQSLFLTIRPEPLWDDLGIRAELDAFRHKLRERLRMERALRPHALTLLSLAHMRRPVLGPHAVRALDRY
jgi:hypothetical protein